MIKDGQLNHIKREVWIDQLRGCAIILVVLGHAIQYGTVNYEDNYYFKLIYSFHMPLFFIISGMLCHEGIEDRISILYIKKSIHRLIYPFVVWLPINFVQINLIEKNIDNSVNIISFFEGVIYHPDRGGLWFLIVLFWVQFLFFIGNYNKKIKEVNHNSIVVFVIVSVAVYLSASANFLGIKWALWYELFFCVGYLLGKYKIIYLAGGIKYVKIIIPMLIIFALYPFAFSSNEVLILPGIDGLVNYKIIYLIIYYALKFFAALVGSFVLIISVRLFFKDKSIAASVFNYFGRNSLEIYALHFLFLHAICKWIPFEIEFLRIGYVFFILIFVSLFALSVTSKNPQINKYLYGR